MEEFLKRTWCEVNKDNIEYNFSRIRPLLKPETKIMGIVKADAYGCGAVYIAKTLENCGVDYFGVSNIEEALQLRSGYITLPILVLGYTPYEYLNEVIDNEITQTIFSYNNAKLLSDKAAEKGKRVKVHIKVDTGMNRLGLLCQSKEEILNTADEIERMVGLPNLIFEGIYTHFAVSDNLQSNYTKTQFDFFMTLLETLEKRNIKFGLRHCCNSAAVINYPEMQLDMVRPGLILYGCYPAENMKDIGIKPVMEFKTIISQIKTIDENKTVSYGRTYSTKKKTKIAILPVGYADGFSSILSGKAKVIIDGIKAPVIGRICMDQCIVDVTDIPNAYEGQTVTIFGAENGSVITVEEVAKLNNTINYEILCLIGKRVTRVYIKDKKVMNTLRYII